MVAFSLALDQEKKQSFIKTKSRLLTKDTFLVSRLQSRKVLINLLSFLSLAIFLVRK